MFSGKVAESSKANRLSHSYFLFYFFALSLKIASFHILGMRANSTSHKEKVTQATKSASQYTNQTLCLICITCKISTYKATVNDGIKE